MNQSADTRFQNDQLRAKQQQQVVPGGELAFNPAHSKGKPAGPPVSQATNPAPNKTVMPGFRPLYEAPEAPQAPQQTSNPIVDSLTREIHLEKLISSPEMEKANTLVRLRHHLRGRKADPKETAAEVLGVLTNYLPRK